MCRDIASGGRRCPSHTNPVLIASRNAKRREAYAKGKHITHKVAPVNGLDENLLRKHPLFNIDLGAASIELFRSTGEIVHNEDLNLTAETYDGGLVEQFYLNRKQLSGVIDYEKLNEESYKDFGFENNQLREGAFHARVGKMSAYETENLTPEEVAAVNFFTSPEYMWVNNCLYGNETRREIPYEYDEGETPDEYVPYFQGEEVIGERFAYHNYHPHNANFLKEFTGYMDSALAKGPKVQRTVYRGINLDKNNFADSSIFFQDRIADYVDKNMKLGQEIVMDGYQSTSISLDTGLGYSGNHGLLLEIVTSSGLNVTAHSQYENEREVVLPRGARYMVVGVHKKAPLSTNRNPNPHPSQVTVVQLVEIDEQGNICNMEHPQVAPALTEKQLHG